MKLCKGSEICRDRVCGRHLIELSSRQVDETIISWQIRILTSVPAEIVLK